MAKISRNPVVAKTVTLPEWMWSIIDSHGKRSGFLREILSADPRFQKEEGKEECTK